MRVSRSGLGAQDTEIVRALRDELAGASLRLELTGRTVLVAASGGVDSTVLAHALATLERPSLAGVALAHVHHGLRGEEADADQKAVEALAATLGVPFASRRVDPHGLRGDCSSRDRLTPQEAARTVRYAALHEMALEVGATRIATAHNADDQAETVLLRLFRGTGPDGLAGIPEKTPDGTVVRPLLRVSRAEIVGYARVCELAWREDSSNASEGYARNRLRHHWLPGLAKDFNPRLLRAIADLAEAQRRDSEWIGEGVAAEAERRLSVEGAWLRIDAKDIAALPESLSRRLAREALVRCGSGRLASRVHLARMTAFLLGARTGTRLELPGDLLLLRDRDGFRLGPMPPRTTDEGPDSAC